MTTAYAASNSLPMSALPTANGISQLFRASLTNTGDATYTPDGLSAAPIFGLGGQPLQGNEIVENGNVTLVSYIGPLLNSGDLCWVLLECTGGAQQTAPATQSQHAVQLGQMTGRLLRKSVYTNVGGTQMLSVNGGTPAATGAGTFDSLPLTTSIIVEAEGGSGGSGGISANSAGQVAASSGGGAAAHAVGMFTADFADGLVVTVGLGGIAGAAGINNGGVGGTSSVGALLTAPGGMGGIGAGATSLPSGPLGIDGSGVSAVPTGANIRGTPGQSSGAVLIVAVNAIANQTGGQSEFGSAGSAPHTTGKNPGNGYGSGPSGTLNGSAIANAAQAGLVGQPGIVIISEYS